MTIIQTSTDVTEPANFRMRLRVRLGKALTETEACRSFVIAGREVTLKSQSPDQPLSDALWVVFGARGFATEEDAWNFGEQLRLMIAVAAISSRVGVDVGSDKATTWLSEEYARASGFIQPHERIAPNIHGLAVFPDDDNTRIPVVDVKATVTSDPAHLLGALSELAEQLPIRTLEALPGLKVLNIALIVPDPLAQIVLAISAVEALGQDENWTAGQALLIERLACDADTAAAAGDLGAAEVADAIRRALHRVSLRQGVMRVLSRLGLINLKKDWDRLYGLRSGLFHGTLTLSDSEISQAALETVTLCGKVVLALLELDGIKPPTVAKTHFGSP